MFKFLFAFIIVAAVCGVGIWKGVPILKLTFHERNPFGWRTVDDDGPLFASPSDMRAKNDEVDEAAFAASAMSSSGRASSSLDQAPKALPPYWGILTETVNGFLTSGKVGGKIPGATIVEQVSRHYSDSGYMIKCRVLRSRDQKWIDDVFIPASAAVFFNETYDATSQEDKNLVIKCFTLRSQIADRKNSFKESAIRSNPHFADYQKIAKEVVGLQAQSKELVAQRDAATGATRNSINDQLRRLKGDEAALLKQFRATEDLYKQWRSTNDDGSLLAQNDPQIRTWTAELMKIEPEVRFRMKGNW